VPVLQERQGTAGSTMSQTETTNTILVVDVDRYITRAVLCDVVEGTARMVDIVETPSTSGPPFLDLSVGALRALRLMEDASGRRILDGERIVTPASPEGDGVDALFVTGVPIPATRVALLCVGDGNIGKVLSAAIRRTTAEIRDAGAFAADANTSLTPRVIDSWLQDARASVLVVLSEGGSMDEWRASLEAVGGAILDLPVEQGIVVADERRQHIAASVLDETLELSGIDPASYGPAEIATAIESEVRDRYANALQQERSLRAFAAGTFVDRIHAVENVATYLHRRMERNVATFQVQDGAILQIATLAGAATVFRADLDLGHHARSLLRFSLSKILNWLPFQLTEDEVVQWLLNRALRPSALLEGFGDRQIGAAYYRELLHALAAEAAHSDKLDIDLLVVGRELIDLSEEVGLLVALDGLQPLPSNGLVMVSVDAEGVMPALGSIAASYPDYAREVIENDFLAPLASCIIVDGNAEDGSVAARGEVTTEGGQVHRFTVPFGQIHLVPLEEGKTAEVEITPGDGLSIGRYASGEPIHFSGDGAVHGGRLGLVIDARGRPPRAPDLPENRVARVRSWISDLGGETG
jgi:hypothetical protein